MLLSLVIVNATSRFVGRTIRQGLIRALRYLPKELADSVVDIALLPVKMLKAILKTAVELLKTIVLTIMQIPLNLAWSVIPGLSTIADTPQISSLL